MKNYKDLKITFDCKDPKINADLVPKIEYMKLGRVVLLAAREAFKDPKVQQDYEEWRRARGI